jgi:hypothetical protein
MPLYLQKPDQADGNKKKLVLRNTQHPDSGTWSRMGAVCCWQSLQPTQHSKLEVFE